MCSCCKSKSSCIKITRCPADFDYIPSTSSRENEISTADGPPGAAASQDAGPPGAAPQWVPWRSSEALQRPALIQFVRVEFIHNNLVFVELLTSCRETQPDHNKQNTAIISINV